MNTEDKAIFPKHFLYFSSRAVLNNILIFVLTFAMGVYMFIAEPNTLGYIAGTCVTAGMAYGLYNIYKKMRNKAPQVIISTEGIETVKAGFNNWSDIKEEQVVTSEGKISVNYLEFDYPGGHEKVNIDDLGIGKTWLEDLLQNYRLHSGK